MNWTEQSIAAVAVIGLLIGVIWILRRRGFAQVALRLGSPGRKRSLESVERLPLTPNHSLHLVRVSGRLILVGVSPSGCSLLENEIPDLDKGPRKVAGVEMEASS